MYRTPYYPQRNDIEKINKEIDEERKKEVVDYHRIMKLEEQKHMPLFSDNLYGNRTRFSSPW